MVDSLPRRAENQKDHFSLCFFLTVGGKICFIPQLACEQALRGVLAAAREKGKTRRESFQPRLWNLNSASNSPVAPIPDGESPLTELSDFRQSARSGNERKC